MPSCALVSCKEIWKNHTVLQHCLTDTAKVLLSVETEVIVISVCLNRGAKGESVTTLGSKIFCYSCPFTLPVHQHGHKAGLLTHGGQQTSRHLGHRYYWISVPTLNLLLWGRFPQNRLARHLHPGLVGHNYAYRLCVWWTVNTWSTSMTNLLSDRLIPLTKHGIKPSWWHNLPFFSFELYQKE